MGLETKVCFCAYCNNCQAILETSFLGSEANMISVFKKKFYSVMNRDEWVGVNEANGETYFLCELCKFNDVIDDQKIAYLDSSLGKSTTKEVIELLGKDIYECKTCNGTGEYDTEYGLEFCGLCNSRLLVFNDQDGNMHHVDWGDIVIRTKDGLRVLNCLSGDNWTERD